MSRSVTGAGELLGVQVEMMLDQIVSTRMVLLRSWLGAIVRMLVTSLAAVAAAERDE